MTDAKTNRCIVALAIELSSITTRPPADFAMPLGHVARVLLAEARAQAAQGVTLPLGAFLGPEEEQTWQPREGDPGAPIEVDLDASKPVGMIEIPHMHMDAHHWVDSSVAGKPPEWRCIKCDAVRLHRCPPTGDPGPEDATGEERTE